MYYSVKYQISMSWWKSIEFASNYTESAAPIPRRRMQCEIWNLVFTSNIKQKKKKNKNNNTHTNKKYFLVSFFRVFRFSRLFFLVWKVCIKYLSRFEIHSNWTIYEYIKKKKRSVNEPFWFSSCFFFFSFWWSFECIFFYVMNFTWKFRLKSS